MTQQEEFLRRVLTWEPGLYYSIWVRHPAGPGEKLDRFSGHAALTLQELLQMVDFYIRIGKDIYVGLASQKEAIPAAVGKKWMKANRRGPNLVALQGLFADVDVNAYGNKPNAYQTQAEAVAAVQKFCIDIGLPQPTIWVDSGSGGMHVYWLADRPLPVAEWTPLAHALANAMRLHGLKADTQCTVDASRVLRVPGTYNMKGATPGLVQMSQPGTNYTVDTLAKALASHTIRVAAVAGVTQPGINADLYGGMSQPIQPIGLDEVANAGCGLFYELIDTEGKHLTSQPLFNHMALTSTFDPDPAAIFHGMCRQNKDYSFASAQAMLDRKLKEKAEKNLGWVSCAQFNLVAPHCQTCPFLSAGKTPFHLVLEERKKQAKQDPAVLPENYSRDEATGFIKGYSGKDKNQTYGVIMPYTATDAGIWTNGEAMALVFKSTPSGKDRHIALPLESAGAPAEVIKHLGRQGIMIPPHAHNSVRNFMVAWTEQLQGLNRTRRSETLGWNEGLFAYGDNVYGSTGVDRTAFYGDNPVTQLYTPQGDLAKWREAARMIVSLKRPDLQVILASAFAAPLVKFASGDAITLSVYSRESGIGKSTTMKIAQAVWGHPTKGLNGLDDTENALIKKVADLANLPLYWDEIKTKGQREKFVSMVFTLASGKNKARLTRDIKAAEVRSFSTMFVGAANDSLANEVVRGTKGTAAGAYRIYEMVIAAPLANSPYTLTQMQTAVRNLEYSYGLAGDVYAAYLGANAATVEANIQALQGALEAKYAITNQERYWLSVMATILIGATLAYRLGLVAFDLAGIEATLAATLQSMRQRVTHDVEQMATPVDVEELIATFISEHRSKNLLITDYVDTGGGRPATNHVHNVDMGGRLQSVWAQLGLKDNLLRVRRKEFKQWLDDEGYNMAQVLDLLTRTYAMRGPYLKTLGAGTMIGGGILDRGQSRVYDIDLPANVSTHASPFASPGYPGPSTPAS